MQASHPASDHKTRRKPRVMRSKEQWQLLLTDYQRSSLTQQAFCEERGITVSSFSKWRNRLAASSELAPFIDLGTIAATDNAGETGSSTPDWQVELELGKDIVLRVRAR